jgi:periplasmic protein CpxP/Spy
MRSTGTSRLCLLAGSALLLAVSSAVSAQVQAPPERGPGCAVAAPGMPLAMHADYRPQGAEDHGHGGPDAGPGFEGPLAPFLRGVELSDDQQDRIFAVLHEQAPRARQAARAAHRAREQLRALATSDSYDETAAKTLADTAAKAEAELGLLRAHADHAVIGVLTAGQRKQALAAPVGAECAGARIGATPWY